jgi:hypothetical protein
MWSAVRCETGSCGFPKIGRVAKAEAATKNCCARATIGVCNQPTKSPRACTDGEEGDANGPEQFRRTLDHWGILLAAVLIVAFRGRIRVALGKWFTLEGEGPKSDTRIAIGEGIKAPGAQLRDMIGSTSHVAEGAEIRVGTQADLTNARLRDMIGQGSPQPPSEDQAAPALEPKAAAGKGSKNKA